MHERCSTWRMARSICSSVNARSKQSMKCFISSPSSWLLNERLSKIVDISGVELNQRWKTKLRWTSFYQCSFRDELFSRRRKSLACSTSKWNFSSADDLINRIRCVVWRRREMNFDQTNPARLTYENEKQSDRVEKNSMVVERRPLAIRISCEWWILSSVVGCKVQLYWEFSSSVARRLRWSSYPRENERERQTLTNDKLDSRSSRPEYFNWSSCLLDVLCQLSVLHVDPCEKDSCRKNCCQSDQVEPFLSVELFLDESSSFGRQRPAVLDEIFFPREFGRWLSRTGSFDPSFPGQMLSIRSARRLINKHLTRLLTGTNLWIRMAARCWFSRFSLCRRSNLP